MTVRKTLKFADNHHIGSLKCVNAGGHFECMDATNPLAVTRSKTVAIWPSAVPLDLTGWDRERQDVEIKRPMVTITANGTTSSFTSEMWPGTRCRVDDRDAMTCKAVDE